MSGRNFMSEFHDELPEAKQTTEHDNNIKDEEEPSRHSI